MVVIGYMIAVPSIIIGVLAAIIIVSIPLAAIIYLLIKIIKYLHKTINTKKIKTQLKKIFNFL